MGTKALLAVVCWLALSKAFGEPGKNVQSLVFKDSKSEESSPRLYRNVPLGVYASAAPYAAYSFHVPQFVHVPKAAASQLVPVKEQYAFLKDSYGNKYVGSSPLSFKNAFPQQFVQLQGLPAHLTQPLVSAAPSFQIKQTVPPQLYFGSQYKLPTLQGPSPTPLDARFGSLSQPFVYAENIKGLSSPNGQHNFNPEPAIGFQGQQINTLQQSTSNREVYANNKPYEQFKSYPNEPKFQRLQEAVSASKDGALQQATESNKAQLTVAPQKTAITTYVNGKKTVVNIETKPPLPLLDLNLLEPLVFDNPLVPQVQHFLPRINEATYHRLPDFNPKEEKHLQKDIVIQNTKSYDSGDVIIGNPKVSGKKKHKKPKSQDETTYQKKSPGKPSVTHYHENTHGKPEVHYEINTPNHKETYNEQVISYNKETMSEPEHYSYDKKTENAPVSYNYVNNQPVQIKHVHYETHGKGENPKQLVYTFKPEEQVKHIKSQSLPATPEHGSENSGESDEEERETPHYREEHRDTPTQHHDKSTHHHEEHHDKPNHYHSEHHEKPTDYHNEPTQHRKEHHGNEPQHHREEPYEHQPHHEEHHEKPRHYHENPPSHQLRPEHREEEYRHSLHSSIPQSHHSLHHEPSLVSQPINVPDRGFIPQFKSITVTPQYDEENIRLISTPSYPSSAPIKVDPNQHVQPSPQSHHHSADSRPNHENLQKQHGNHKHHEHEQRDNHHQRPRPIAHHHNNAPIHVQEKAKRVIIQEETPDELHSHTEQMMAEMIDQEENSEEDFEKAYKDAAYGFPAYNNKESDDEEKDIYDPESYGVPAQHTEYDIEHTPFQQYVEDGDKFPKATRLGYKDARDKMKEEYVLDYSLSKPESLLDRYKNKENYFKAYESQKPKNFFSRGPEENNKKAKYVTLGPSFEYVTSDKKQKPFAQYKALPVNYEYNYDKPNQQRDNSAFASRPHIRYKTKTLFVEPQFQYGFEPIGLPRLLDSELAAMATNLSPKSEKTGTRKKVFKENWYIKKTSTASGKPGS